MRRLRPEAFAAASKGHFADEAAFYAEMERDPVHRYDTALYWRFLYESSGDMRIVRAALEEMACRHDPDIEAHLGDLGRSWSLTARHEGVRRFAIRAYPGELPDAPVPFSPSQERFYQPGARDVISAIRSLF